MAPSVAARFVGSTLRARFVGSPWSGWADAELARHRPSVMLAWAAALGRFSSRAWIGDIDVPDGGGGHVPRRAGADGAATWRSAAAIPGATVVDLDGDHGVFVTDPSAFAAALVEACRRVTTD